MLPIVCALTIREEKRRHALQQPTVNTLSTKAWRPDPLRVYLYGETMPLFGIAAFSSLNRAESDPVLDSLGLSCLCRLGPEDLAKLGDEASWYVHGLIGLDRSLDYLADVIKDFQESDNPVSTEDSSSDLGGLSDVSGSIALGSGLVDTQGDL